jgi:hypothetical protein
VHNKEALDNTEGAIKNGQSRETGNIGYTVHITHFSQVKQLFSAFIAEKYTVLSNASLLCTYTLHQ